MQNSNICYVYYYYVPVQFNYIDNFPSCPNNNAIENECKLITSDEDIWYDKFNELKKYIDDNNKLPSFKSKLSRWLKKQKINYKFYKNSMSNETIRNEWEKLINDEKYKYFFIINEEIWYDKFNELKCFVDINGKLPVTKTKLGSWLNEQKQNYKYNMENKKIKKEWEIFINDDKYKHLFISRKNRWFDNFNKIKIYIDVNGSLPIEDSDLGKWISEQKKSYEHNIDDMLKKNVRKEWESFMNDNKYKKYFY